MANNLIMRFYPVDGEYSSAESNGGSFGIGVWIQAGEPPWYDYNYSNPTMAVPSQEYPDYAAVGQFAHDNMAVAYFDAYTLSGSMYVEVEVQLLSPAGSVIPLTSASFPLDVYLAGLGAYPTPPTDPANPVWEGSGSNYAGGVLEIGFYDETNAYVSLSAIWVDAGFFQPKADGTSFDNPMLPASTSSQFYFDESTGLLTITLESNTIPPAFWVNKRNTTETI